MRPPLSEQVVVVTGASSGIGRETARMLGAAGAAVVLAARNDEGLREIKDEIEASGGRAITVVTDVSDWYQVEQLAYHSMNWMGRIDTWVNNAGIAVYGDFDQNTPEELRRVVEVNLLGEMYGAKAALLHMKARGEGAIINVSSVVARKSVPLLASYCAAKRGVTGFTESLRLELQKDFPNIHVIEVLPASINTPFFEHARSRLEGQATPRPIPPVYQPQVVARAILRACEHPQREIFAGGAGKGLDLGGRWAPGLLDFFLRRGNTGERVQQEPGPDDHVDNLFEPMDGPGETTGRWNSEARARSFYTSAIDTHRARAALIGALAVAGVLAMRRRA